MAKKTDKEKSALSSMQAVTYQREFKMADRAGGFMDRKGRKVLRLENHIILHHEHNKYGANSPYFFYLRGVCTWVVLRGHKSTGSK